MATFKMNHNQKIGKWGEQAAAEYIQNKGYSILGKNIRTPHGEIDIIAKDGETLVFCEVKSRRSDEFGDPEYAIPPRKQQQIRKIARGYLFEHEIKEQDCRFDVVAIRMRGNTPEINYMRNAF